jgi:hypothetical protein
MGYGSFVGHLLRVGERDVSGASGIAVTSVIGGLRLISVCALIAALRVERK